MKTLETERLILRKYITDDFSAVQSYANCEKNLIFIGWGPNSEEQTKDFIKMAIKESENDKVNKDYPYAVTLRDSGKLIGGCDIHVKGDEASLGWILHRDYWKRGYGTETGKELLRFGFEELELHRIIARCDADNIGSYRIMEKIGMRREGLFLDVRQANKLSAQKYSDELSYAILKEEWETHKEIAYYNSLPCVFNGFIDVPVLSDGEITIFCNEKSPAIPEKRYLPVYRFYICKDGEAIGWIHIIIGYNDLLYYNGQIAYHIFEKFRGNGYAARACRLLLPMAKAHEMGKLLITNNVTNAASRRVCEKLDAKLLRVARVPEWHELYKEGQRLVNIFEWSVE